MRIIFLLLMFSPAELFANSFYIVPDDANGLPVVIGTNRPPKNILYRSPKDNLGVQVKTIEDLTIVKLKTLACNDQFDCDDKVKTICIKELIEVEQPPLGPSVSIPENGDPDVPIPSIPNDPEFFEVWFENSKAIISSDLSEVFCASPRYSASKRAARLNAIKGSRGIEKTKRELFDSKLLQIKAACNGSNGLTKLMCEYISRNK